MDCIFPFMKKKKKNKKNMKNTHNDDAGSAGLNGRMERDNGLQNSIHVERQPVPQTPELMNCLQVEMGSVPPQTPEHVKSLPIYQRMFGQRIDRELVCEIRYPTRRYYAVQVPIKPPKQDSDREGKEMPKPQNQVSRELEGMSKNAYLYSGLSLCCVVLNLLIILFLRMYGVTNPMLRTGIQFWIMILMLGCFFTCKSRYSSGAPFKPVHLTVVGLFSFSSFVVFILFFMALINF